MNKKRILITNFHPWSAGGHLSYIVSIISSSLREEFELAVAAPETSDLSVATTRIGCSYYPSDFPSKLHELWEILTRASSRFRKIVKEFQPDLIHTNGGADRTIVLLNYPFYKKKPRIIQTFHWNKVLKSDLIHKIIHNHCLDQNIFVSRSAFKESGGEVHRNSVVIENGVDLEKYVPLRKDELLRERWGIPKDHFIFGSSGGLYDYKRVDLMLEAVRMFPTDAPFRVIVLGRDPEEWVERVKKMGIAHFFIFPGYQEDVRPFCSLFDVGFILSTRVETASFASREMMAMGIPLISSYYSGLKDNLDSYVNGIYVEPGNVPEIHRAMDLFLKMPSSELISYRGKARLHAERSFDRKKQISQLRELYTQVHSKFGR